MQAPFALPDLVYLLLGLSFMFPSKQELDFLQGSKSSTAHSANGFCVGLEHTQVGGQGNPKAYSQYFA